MAIMIREYLENNTKFAQNTNDYDGTLHLSESRREKADVDALDPDSLMVEIEGIHAAPFATRNYTRYTAKCLKNSVPSWTEPYRRPVIKHHNEETGEPIGRVVDVKYVNRDTRSGTPALVFTINVPDKAAKESIQNGLLSTVSIGVIAHDVRCSICGKPIIDADEGCEEHHQRGVTYQTENGQQTCYWDIHEMEAKEISYVDVPSDMYAKNIDIYPATNQQANTPTFKESANSKIRQKGEHHMPQENKEHMEKISELEKEVDGLKEINESLTKEKDELKKEIDGLKANLTELEESKKELEASKSELEATVEEATHIKESMEKEIADAKAEIKKNLAETFIMMREALGQKITDEEAIKKRAVESLKDSIVDMKESFVKKEEKKDILNPKEMANSVEDPTPPGNTEVKETNEDSKVDLKAGLKNIFGSIMSTHC